ncbi:uncharacterized protein LOC135931655 isoform X2 [Gordionus sp. m RMFG-2023]
MVDETIVHHCAIEHFDIDKKLAKNIGSPLKLLDDDSLVFSSHVKNFHPRLNNYFTDHGNEDSDDDMRVKYRLGLKKRIKWDLPNNGESNISKTGDSESRFDFESFMIEEPLFNASPRSDISKYAYGRHLNGEIKRVGPYYTKSDAYSGCKNFLITTAYPLFRYDSRSSVSQIYTAELMWWKRSPSNKTDARNVSESYLRPIGPCRLLKFVTPQGKSNIEEAISYYAASRCNKILNHRTLPRDAIAFLPFVIAKKFAESLIQSNTKKRFLARPSINRLFILRSLHTIFQDIGWSDMFVNDGDNEDISKYFDIVEASLMEQDASLPDNADRHQSPLKSEFLEMDAALLLVLSSIDIHREMLYKSFSNIAASLCVDSFYQELAGIDELCQYGYSNDSWDVFQSNFKRILVNSLRPAMDKSGCQIEIDALMSKNPHLRPLSTFMHFLYQMSILYHLALDYNYVCLFSALNLVLNSTNQRVKNLNSDTLVVIDEVILPENKIGTSNGNVTPLNDSDDVNFDSRILAEENQDIINDKLFVEWLNYNSNPPVPFRCDIGKDGGLFAKFELSLLKTILESLSLLSSKIEHLIYDGNSNTPLRCNNIRPNNKRKHFDVLEPNIDESVMSHPKTTALSRIILNNWCNQTPRTRLRDSNEGASFLPPRDHKYFIIVANIFKPENNDLSGNAENLFDTIASKTYDELIQSMKQFMVTQLGLKVEILKELVWDQMGLGHLKLLLKNIDVIIMTKEIRRPMKLSAFGELKDAYRLTVIHYNSDVSDISSPFPSRDDDDASIHLRFNRREETSYQYKQKASSHKPTSHSALAPLTDVDDCVFNSVLIVKTEFHQHEDFQIPHSPMNDAKNSLTHRDNSGVTLINRNYRKIFNRIVNGYSKNVRYFADIIVNCHTCVCRVDLLSLGNENTFSVTVKTLIALSLKYRDIWIFLESNRQGNNDCYPMKGIIPYLVAKLKALTILIRDTSASYLNQLISPDLTATTRPKLNDHFTTRFRFVDVSSPVEFGEWIDFVTEKAREMNEISCPEQTLINYLPDDRESFSLASPTLNSMLIQMLLTRMSSKGICNIDFNLILRSMMRDLEDFKDDPFQSLEKFAESDIYSQLLELVKHCAKPLLGLALFNIHRSTIFDIANASSTSPTLSSRSLTYAENTSHDFAMTFKEDGRDMNDGSEPFTFDNSVKDTEEFIDKEEEAPFVFDIINIE